MALHGKAACSACISNSSQVLFLGALTHPRAWCALPILSHRMLKRCVFKYQDLMKVVILLHHGWSLVKPVFVSYKYTVVKDAMTTPTTLHPNGLPTVACVQMQISYADIVKKPNNVFVFLWKYFWLLGPLESVSASQGLWTTLGRIVAPGVSDSQKFTPYVFSWCDLTCLFVSGISCK